MAPLSYEMLEKELSGALSQVDRWRRKNKELTTVLQWIADHECRHKQDGGICFPCYARSALRMPDHITDSKNEP